MADLPRNAEVPPWVVFHSDGKVNPVFEIALNRFHDRNLSVECDIENVGLLARMQTNPVAFPKTKFRGLPQPANCAVHLCERLGRKRFRTVQNAARSVVPLPDLLLLLVAQCKNTKR